MQRGYSCKHASMQRRDFIGQCTLYGICQDETIKCTNMNQFAESPSYLVSGHKELSVGRIFSNILIHVLSLSLIEEVSPVPSQIERGHVSPLLPWFALVPLPIPPIFPHSLVNPPLTHLFLISNLGTQQIHIPHLWDLICQFFKT